MIQTKIARVISTTEVVLAAGSEQGVHEGMEFVIYALSDVILDPETGNSLGQLEIVKGRIKAVHVQEKICIAITKSQTVTETITPGGLAIANMFKPYEVKRTVYPDLKVEQTNPLPTDLTVRLGDLVRSTQ